LEVSGDGYTTLTVYGSTDKRFDTVLQNFTAQADDGDIKGIFYDIVIHGCCGAENSHTVYNWSTGRPVAMYSDDKPPLAVSTARPHILSRKQRRYVGGLRMYRLHRRAHSLE
jgi:hypothetical protein